MPRLRFWETRRYVGVWVLTRWDGWGLSIRTYRKDRFEMLQMHLLCWDARLMRERKRG